MNIYVNEVAYPCPDGISVQDVAAKQRPDADLFIVNGFPVGTACILADGDRCWLIKRGDIPSHQEMEHLLYSRHTPGVHGRVKSAAVGIMGLGGLGSVVAIALARIGVGRLILADFDIVEPSNLNRQQYFINQVGYKKTVAMAENLTAINPYVAVKMIDVRLDAVNIPEFFADVDVLVECFDDPAMKACGLRCALTKLQNVGYVGSSGLAGYGDNNAIQTRHLKDRVYIVGDGDSAAEPGQGLMAPRVGIAAHHQANQVLRILLDRA